MNERLATTFGIKVWPGIADVTDDVDTVVLAVKPQHMREAAAALQPHWTVDVRTGDTDAAARSRQQRRLPSILVTTPESLTLMLSRPDWRERFQALTAVVVDEWHELLAS